MHYKYKLLPRFDTLNSLSDADFSKSVFIRGEEHTIGKALIRSLTHISYHVGQIVYLARHYAADDWKTLSIAKGESEVFNKTMLSK